MERRFAALALVLLTGRAPALAQSGSTSPSGGVPVPPARAIFGPPGNSPDPANKITQRAPVSVPLTISGKVVVDGGGPPPSPAFVETRCEGVQGGLTYSDRKGRFSVTVGQKSELAEAAMDGDTTFRCTLEASLAGYRTARADAYSPGDRPVLTLHLLGPTAGTVVSYTDLNVPKRAREARDRGMTAVQKHDWTTAQAEFEKALELYPQYATACYDLGSAFAQQGRLGEARSAWNKSIELDNRFLKPYVHLAELAAAQSRWAEMAGITDRAVALDPVNAPILYLYQAMAYFNLGRMDTAEQSARQAIAADPRHELPRAEYILGRALAHKNDYSGALEHMRRYLELSPHAPDAALVRSQIAKAENSGGVTGSN